MFKVNNKNTRTRSEICSKLTMKTPERRQSYISYLTFFFVFLVNFEQVNAGWKEAALKYLTKYAENIHVLVLLQVKLQAVGMQRYQKRIPLHAFHVSVSHGFPK